MRSIILIGKKVFKLLFLLKFFSLRATKEAYEINFFSLIIIIFRFFYYRKVSLGSNNRNLVFEKKIEILLIFLSKYKFCFEKYTIKF